MVAKTSASPLARLTILLQTRGLNGAPTDAYGLSRHIIKTEGVLGLFRGNSADILRTMPHTAIQYLSYEYFKAVVAPFDESRTKVWSRLFCGGMAGAIGIVSTYPLDMVRSRLAVQSGTSADRYRGILHGLQTIRAEEGGIVGLYRGCGMAVVERFPNMAINFATYDICKNVCIENDLCEGMHGVMASLACGAVSGIISSTCTFPMDVVMRNLQVTALAACLAVTVLIGLCAYGAADR